MTHYLLDGRYELRERIDGGQATVHRSIDTLTDRQVAVKVYPGQTDSPSPDWREAAFLRRLQLPGVIRLIDEGVLDTGSYLVTPWVEGEPFPGPYADDPDRLENLIVAIAETLARLHAVGIVHGDLKPNNVLVDPEGRPKLLDFGLARRHRSRPSRESGRLAGSIAYMSPRQLRGRTATRACDCYALGVMCYETLVGRRPHAIDSLPSLIRARFDNPSPRIDEPLPALSAASVEGLLNEEPHRRRTWLDRLCRFGNDATDRALTAMWGRQPFLRELLERLDEGESIRVAPGACPPAQARRMLVDLLQSNGHTVDDLDRLVRLVDRGEEADLTVELPAAEALETLFAGPQRLFETRTRAARILWQRTHGHPDALASELGHWSRQGIGYWQDDRLHLQPEQLARLERQTGLQTRFLPAPDDPLPPRLGELLGWIQLGGRASTVSRLADWLDRPRAQLEADIDRLDDRRVLQRVGDEQLVALRSGLNETDASDPHLQQRHRTIADTLPEGHPQRFHHLLRGGTAGQIIDEASAVARHYDRTGQTEPAIDVIQQALDAVDHSDHADGLQPLFAIWADVALATSEPAKLEDWLGRADDWRAESEPIDRIGRLVELARMACRSGDDRLIDELADLPPFDDWQLEVRRQMYRVRLATIDSPERLAQLLDEIEGWVEAADRDEVTGSFYGWRGMLSFRQGDFDRAADWHARAAETKRRPTARLASLISQSTARMEALDFREALELARSGRSAARQLKHVHYRARIERLIRANRYRLGEQLEADEDFVDTVDQLGIPRLTGAIALNEAAIAWRNDASSQAARLADRAREIWVGAGQHLPAKLARALSFHCRPGSREEALALAEELNDAPLERLALQGLALVCDRVEALPDDLLAALLSHYQSIPRHQRDARFEILTAREALQMTAPADR